MKTPETLAPETISPRNDEALRLYNQIQMALIARDAKSKGIGVDTAAEKWIAANSGAFAKISKLRPELIDRYKDDPGGVLEELETLLAD